MAHTLLVTGGAGFIGSNFVRYWLHHHPGDRVIVLDALTYAGNPANLAGLIHHPQFRFIQGNICEQNLVADILETERVDTIVNFAAETHVDRSITGPDAFIETNVVGTHSLLKAARQCWLEKPGGLMPHRFHHVSTDEVYGSLGPDDPAFSETTLYAPNSPYSASKAASDHLVRAYHHTFGLQVTTSNCSNNYGPYQFPEKLIPLMILNILEGIPLPVYGDGLNVRDWLYVDDHALGIDLILAKGRVGETYNIGGINEWKNIDLVRLLCRLTDDFFAADLGLKERYPQAPPACGYPCSELITFVTDRPGHDRRYAIDATKASRDLGYRPQETFNTGIVKTIRWYLGHRDWCQAVKDGSYRQSSIS